MDLLDLLSHYTLWVGNMASNFWYSGIKGKKCNRNLPFCGFSSTCETCCVTDVYLQIPVVFVLSGMRTDGSFFQKHLAKIATKKMKEKGLLGPILWHFISGPQQYFWCIICCFVATSSTFALLCCVFCHPQQHRGSLLGRGICLRLPGLKTLGGLCGPGSLGFAGPVITTVLFTHLTTRVFHGTRNCYRSCAFILRFRWPFSVLLKETWIFPAEPRHKHLCLDPPV